MLDLEISKSPEIDFSGDLMALLTESDDESDFLLELQVEEDRIKEIMQVLYTEITSCGTTNHEPPPPPPALFLPSPPYVGVRAKSESCAVAVSDSASSVMAGIEIVGPVSAVKVAEADGMEVDVDVGVGGYLSVEEMKMMKVTLDGCGGEDSNQWLARLDWGPLDLGEEWCSSK